MCKSASPPTITLRSLPGKTFKGHVERIEMQSDPVNEERLVDVAFDQLPDDIHLAEQAEIVVTTGQLPRAVLVSATAVQSRREDHGLVWTVEDGRLSRRDVTLGAELLDGRLPILGGLPARRRRGGRTHLRHARRARGPHRRGIEVVNLALRDMRRNGLRFALTAAGLGLLLGIVVSMMGIYEGALDDALALAARLQPGPLGGAAAHVGAIRRALAHSA